MKSNRTRHERHSLHQMRPGFAQILIILLRRLREEGIDACNVTQSDASQRDGPKPGALHSKNILPRVAGIACWTRVAWLTAALVSSACATEASTSNRPSNKDEAGTLPAAGKPCDFEGELRCGSASSLLRCGDDELWKPESACAGDQACGDGRPGPNGIAFHAAEGAGCCDKPKFPNCKDVCIAALAEADSSALLDTLEPMARAIHGCDGKSASCLCKLFENAGNGFCSLPCDGSGTTKFVVFDRKINDIQAISAFPAVIDQNGGVKRVCGAALANEPTVAPNGMELTLNLTGSPVHSPACGSDADLSIKEGEFIELSALLASGGKPTIEPGNFKINLDCVEAFEQAVGTGCVASAGGRQLTASTVRYAANTKRCAPSQPETWLNVAVLIDSSGSTTGFVDPVTRLEDAGAVPDGKLVSSDPGDARILAVETFVNALNGRDRVIAYHFGENLPDGLKVVATDDAACVGGVNAGGVCAVEAQCPGGTCVVGENAKGNSFSSLSRVDAETRAFGNGLKRRGYLLHGLQEIKDEGVGRAPLWSALNLAADSLVRLAADASSSQRHIVVLTDGPDSCAHGENLRYTGSDGACRTPCSASAVTFQEFRAKLAASGYPVTIHFIQWQAPGYKEPDAEMMEIACRTGGTYQFLNFQEMDNSNLDALNDSMRQAIVRVRYTLSGSWRIGFGLGAMQPSPAEHLKTGQLYAASGSLRFESTLFTSVNSAYENSTNWKFGTAEGGEDRRLLFRQGCGAASDCGGTGECAPQHCSAGGLCRSGAAPDNLPCQGGVCCEGACTATCAGTCK